MNDFLDQKLFESGEYTLRVSNLFIFIIFVACVIILLMDLLKKVAAKHEQVLKVPMPFIRFEDYGDSSLIFGVYFYSNEIFRSEKIKSEIRIEIFKTLKENGITIPFPQRVVHTKKTLE